MRVLVAIAYSWFVSSWLLGKAYSLVRQKTKTEKAYVVDRQQSKAHMVMNAKNIFKMANNIFIPSTAQLPYCIIYFVPSRSFFLNLRFLHALIFYQPKTTFQTVENNFPDRASIFRQLTFFTFHQTYFTLQWWMGKCQCQALLKANQSTVSKSLYLTKKPLSYLHHLSDLDLTPYTLRQIAVFFSQIII